MAAELFVPPSKALDANANPYAGAKWFFYLTGTTTPATVYTTAVRDVPHSNPVVADSTGKFSNIYFDPTVVYRAVLKNLDETVTLHDIDPVNSGTLAALAASGGSALVGFLQAGTGAVARTAQAKMRDTVSVKDFNATGDGVTNDTAAFNAALATGKDVFVPAGTYIVDHVVIPAAGNVEIYGEAGTIMRPIVGEPQAGLTPDIHGALIYCRSSAPAVQIPNITIRGITFYGRVETQAFQEFDHLVALSGVDNVLIENCVFKGFRGDGFYCGAGEEGGERENFNITVRSCVFDGINKDNRNAISVITASGVTIDDCSFANCTKTTMPGAIDFEPDNFAYYYNRAISITNCRFSNVGGNVGVIALRVPVNAQLPSGVAIDNCYFTGNTNGSEIFCEVQRVVANTAVDMGLSVTNCVGLGGSGGVYYLASLRGFYAANNSWSTYAGICRIGFNRAEDYVSNVKIEDTFINCGTGFDASMTIYDGEAIDIGGFFIDCGNGGATSSAISFAGTSTTSNVTLRCKVLSPTAGKTKRAVRDDGHTFTPATNLDLMDNSLGDGTNEFKSINRTLTATPITFSNGWVAFGDANIQDAAVTKDAEGYVYLHGLCKDGTATSGTVIATLAAGYRPLKNQYFVVWSNNTAGMVRITTAGTITAIAVNALGLAFDGIVFQASK